MKRFISPWSDVAKGSVYPFKACGSIKQSSGYGWHFKLLTSLYVAQSQRLT